MSNPPGSLPRYANIWSTALPVCVILTVMNNISPIERLFPNHAMSLAYKRYDATPSPILYTYCIHTSANFQEILAVLRSFGTLLGQIAAGCFRLSCGSRRDVKLPEGSRRVTTEDGFARGARYTNWLQMARLPDCQKKVSPGQRPPRNRKFRCLAPPLSIQYQYSMTILRQNLANLCNILVLCLYFACTLLLLSGTFPVLYRRLLSLRIPAPRLSSPLFNIGQPLFLRLPESIAIALCRDTLSHASKSIHPNTEARLCHHQMSSSC